MPIYADLADFGLGAMVRLASKLREAGHGATSAQELAQRTCALLHQSFVGPDGRPQTALVRLYATTRCSDLPVDERPPFAADATCLTLLGTVGLEPAWNDRTRSAGHRVLPLLDEEQVAQMPMIAGLLEQLGVDVRALTAAEYDVLLPAGDERCRIFFVPTAQGSPLIPAQDFVETYGIRSAIGFGGALPGGEVFAAVVFSTVPVTRAAAELFETVALSLSLSWLDLEAAPLLPGAGPRRVLAVEDGLRARVDVSTALVLAHERASVVESDRALLAQARAEYDSRRTAALAAVAVRLASVQSVSEIPDVLVSEGLVFVGAEGVALALVDDARLTAEVVISTGYGADAALEHARLPLDDALPATRTARTGEVVLIQDTELEDPAYPTLQAVARQVGVRAAATLPLLVGDRLIGSLTCSWPRPHVFDVGALEVMQALAAQVAQVADRARLVAREREHSTALQRSLLSEPPEVDGLLLQARYLPAEQAMQVGGDWYDAFPQSDGATMLVIGDVVGHDTAAAAAMAQIRGLLRGTAWTGGGPADVLRRVDDAIDGLALGVTATALVARLERDALRWSSAGHPPPMFVCPQGTVRELGAESADLLLGVDARTERAEQQFTLMPGCTVLLYTDGLIERRGEDLDQGLARLRGTVENLAGLELAELCDALLDRMCPGADDDIALLAVRYLG